MMLPPSRIGKVQNFPINPRKRTQGHSHAIDNSSPVPEVTPTGMASTASTAKSRTILKMNARREFEKTNHAETNKDVLIGLKCM